MQVPNLPGFRSNRPVPRPKLQNFQRTNGMVTEKHAKPAVEAIPPGKHIVDRISELRSVHPADKERYLATKRMNQTRNTMTLGKSAELQMPPEVAMDRQVLRFYAYYQEAVHESRLEDSRVRRVTIQVFLSDMTFLVVEDREDNSGIPQGVMLKRQRIPVPCRDRSAEPEFYEWRDLCPLGTEITFYGRTMRVIDCDPFTREWCERQGADVGEPEEVPIDSAAQARMQATLSGPKATGYAVHRKVQYDAKMFMEASRGKFIRDPEALRKFLHNDRKVLRFFCIWDDTERMYGDKNPINLHYFLADDTVEVKEVPVANSGKPQFSTMLRRQKLPRDWRKRQEAEASKDPAMFVQPEDIWVGSTINMFGRELQIRGADPFTRQWYREVLGAEQPEDMPSEVQPKYRYPVLVPPHDGIGDPADTLGSVYHLVPKPPQKDAVKFMAEDGNMYRFRARLANPCAEDAIRRFVIQLYPSDDTLSIYELPVRNSGITSGTFLKRGKYQHPSGRPWQGPDFVPGNEVSIERRVFLVYDADSFTRNKFPEVNVDGPDAVGMPAAVEELMGRIRESLSRGGHSSGLHGVLQLQAFCKEIDTDKNGTLNAEEIRTGLRDLTGGEVNLSLAELEALMMWFDKDNSGLVDYNEFIAGVRGSIPRSRLDLINKAWSRIDVMHEGRVFIEDILRMHRPGADPRVQAGEMTIEEAKAEEAILMKRLSGDDNYLSREEFFDYMHAASAAIPQDEAFRQYLRTAWPA